MGCLSSRTCTHLLFVISASFFLEQNNAVVMVKNNTVFSKFNEDYLLCNVFIRHAPLTNIKSLFFPEIDGRPFLSLKQLFFIF